MPTIELPNRGATIHYERRGSGPPLILLNGLSQTTASWRSQMRHLRERFDVIAYDARGQGRSTLGALPLTLEDQVDDLCYLMDSLGVSRAHFCGFSHGARVALAMAAMRPERVDRLILTSLGTSDNALRRLIIRSWLEVLQIGGVEAMAWTTLPVILGTKFVQQHESQVDAMIRATVQRNTAEGLHALLSALQGYPPPQEEARRVQAPTLLITSDEDLLVPPDDARSLAALLPYGEHVMISGCGHTVPIERPEPWRRQVLSFLA